ncbi:hypothetical protein FC678_24660, partial [Peribacillus simplex]
MINKNELIDAITSVLKDEKTYVLPNVCVNYGLEDGEETEAHSSKRVYVQKRLKGKDQFFLLDLAKRIIKDYGANASNLSKIVLRIDPTGLFSISEVTRRNIMDELYAKGNIEGRHELTDFLNRIWNLENMPSTNRRFKNASVEIWQHMINNDDWDNRYLYETYLELLLAPDQLFIHFLEQVVHPIVRHQSQKEFIELINHHLVNDNFQFYQTEVISGFPLFKINEIQAGVKGIVKNLIFAAIGYKPEIVISDSINNDIKIVKNAENCLVYDRPIPNAGLSWNDMVVWWADIKGLKEVDAETEVSLYKRLLNSLDSEPEKILFHDYFKFFKVQYN